MQASVLLLLSFSLNYELIIGARIFGTVFFPSISHQVAFRPLWKELSLRGHQLVVHTTDPIDDPTFKNLTEINHQASYDVWRKHLDPLMSDPKHAYVMMETMMQAMLEIFDQQLRHPDSQKLFKNKNEYFDLVVAEVSPVAFKIAKRFQCPLIVALSLDSTNYFYNTFGNPVHPTVNPDVNLPFTGKLDFFEKIQSVSYEVLMSYLTTYHINIIVCKVQEYISNNLLDGFHELLDEMSLFFLNTNIVFNQIRPLMPNVVQIGRGSKIHCQVLKPLPKELNSQIDNAIQGFIYFSLGSNVKSKDLPDGVKNALIEAFADLPYKVLWKFELEELPKKPDNVIISKWFPQQDIFRHPNIKLFITQGGVQSIDEAIYDHIPMLGLPFYLDQVPNVKRMVDKGLGLSLDYKTLNKETFKETILELINNPKYRSRVKELTDLAQDQPMTGLEKAVWWTEYVIRHKGAKHLKSPLLKIPNYQYYLLDVIGFCLAVIVIVMYISSSFSH